MKRIMLTFTMIVAVMVLCGVEMSGQTDRPSGLRGAAPPLGGAFGFGKGADIHSVAIPAQTERLRPPVTWMLGIRRTVPGDYPTIQDAIDASLDGDTVLVSEGTYLENIRYLGKAITVASLFLIDGDTTHVERTIIDGSNPSHPDSGSVVSFIDGEDTTSVLCGFTITGGTGTKYHYEPGELWTRGGGGIYCFNSGARIINNIIVRNKVTAPDVTPPDLSSAFGGGVLADNLTLTRHNIILDSNVITDNVVYGITNTWWNQGGGARIFSVDARVSGNIFERDTVISNFGGTGAGMAFGFADPGYLLPGGKIEGNIFRSNVVTATSEGAVGVGMSLVQTAETSISDNLLENNTGISIYGWSQGGGLLVDDHLDPIYGRKVIEDNRFLSNGVSQPEISWMGGGGVFLYYTLATLDGNEILENSAQGQGGGMAVENSSFRIQNNIIGGNNTPSTGGGVYVLYPQSEKTVINNTITGNRATSYGGGLGSAGGTTIALNNIFWGDSARSYSEILGSVTVRYSDVQGGYTGEGNLDVDPAFVAGTYALGDGSPLIGAGRDSLEIGGVWYYAPDSCFLGNPRPSPPGSLPDIGACENLLGNPTGIAVRPGSAPLRFALGQNYPNPFNPGTTISYHLPVRSDVTLKVFDVLGKEVATLVNGPEDAGHKSVTFNASNLASGIYFYRLQARPFVHALSGGQAGSFVETKKLILMK